MNDKMIEISRIIKWFDEIIKNEEELKEKKFEYDFGCHLCKLSVINRQISDIFIKKIKSLKDVLEKEENN